LIRAVQFVDSLDDYCHESFFKLYNTFAYLENGFENYGGSLEYLSKAIDIANQFSKINNDPLALMPAETLLNAATACSYLSSHKSALQYADSAERSSQVALSAIHHLMGLESPGTHSMRELERMRKAQLDINIMAAIAKANPLERLGHFKQAFEALDRGERMVAEQYGKAHPMMSEFTQLREEIKEQQEFSRGSHWKEGDGDFEGIDMRSEIMKKGRIKRVYYEVQENIINEDKRAQMSSIEAESTNMTQKSHKCHNSCGCHRGGGQDSVTQLMQTRMMQDEQFRMMELMIETQQPEVRHHHHVIQRSRESSPSSSSSDDVVPSETSSSAT
jgi:tetratricopeptide (TPR) repeat protein